MNGSCSISYTIIHVKPQSHFSRDHVLKLNKENFNRENMKHMLKCYKNIINGMQEGFKLDFIIICLTYMFSEEICMDSQCGIDEGNMLNNILN
jgi:hypothetical protein